MTLFFCIGGASGRASPPTFTVNMPADGHMNGDDAILSEQSYRGDRRTCDHEQDWSADSYISMLGSPWDVASDVPLGCFVMCPQG